jgi:hypothetical protein
MTMIHGFNEASECCAWTAGVGWGERVARISRERTTKVRQQQDKGRKDQGQNSS